MGRFAGGIRRASASICLVAGVLLAGSAVAQEITVSGTQFLKDGTPWVAEGVTLVGRVATAEDVVGRTAYERARKMFGPEILEDVRGYGADLVRYQFSQAGLDPQSDLYDPDYIEEVREAIAMTRKAGFPVIVSMQWQGPSGRQEGDSGMPTDSTDRAWLQLIGDLATDKGIMLEVYNEPSLRKRSPENWETWRADMQGLIYLLRGAGSQNVLMVGGLNYATYLNNSPELVDPMGQLAYAVHPFLYNTNQTEKQWTGNFGKFAKDHAVMATAFMAWSGNKACNENYPEITMDLLDYLNKRDIGLVIWAFDLGVVRKNGGALRTFDGFACGGKVHSAAAVIHEYFMAN